MLPEPTLLIRPGPEITPPQVKSPLSPTIKSALASVLVTAPVPVSRAMVSDNWPISSTPSAATVTLAVSLISCEKVATNCTLAEFAAPTPSPIDKSPGTSCVANPLSRNTPAPPLLPAEATVVAPV